MMKHIFPDLGSKRSHAIYMLYRSGAKTWAQLGFFWLSDNGFITYKDFLKI